MNNGKHQHVPRWAIMAVVTAMTVAAAGCGITGSNKSRQQAEQEAKTSAGIMDVSFVNYVWDDTPPAEGPGLKMIQDRFKINVKPQFVPQADYISKLSVMMASGSIPDVVGVKDLDSNFFNWAKQGAFLSLNEYYNKYPTLKQVPAYIRDQFQVNGNYYAIPRYYPTQYLFVIVLRKDWLDRLNLPVPRSYEELKKVAIAFTKQDPDGNGKADTYGLALSQSLSPDYSAGTYWDPNAWYHRDAQGRLIPGLIGPGRKQVIQMLADLYKEGAVTKEFAVLNWIQGNKEFYSGRAGIFIGTPRGMSEVYMDGLLKTNPEAKFLSIEPFAAPDGSQGFTTQAGFLGFTALSSKLASEPDKVARIMDAIDFGRTFIPPADRKPDNPDYDWRNGKLGVGYTFSEGAAVQSKVDEGKIPSLYLFDNFMWAPGDEANQYSAYYKIPALKQLTGEMEKMFVKYKDKTYINPRNGIDSPTDSVRGTELTKMLIVEQTKMITGQRPVSDWDQMVKEWLDRGGEAIIREVNQGIEEKKK